MNWKTNKLKISSVLDDNGYAEISDFIDNTKISIANSQRTYSIMPLSEFGNSNTASRVMLNNVATVTCNYMADTIDEFDTLYEEFIDLMATILQDNKAFSVVIQPKINKPVTKNNRVVTMDISINMGSTLIC